MSQLALEPTVDDAAEELYGLPPWMFVPARQRHADAARVAGDPRAAALIAGLRKPSAGAWMSNQLVRWSREEVLAFLDLGRALRYATENFAGNDLWQLTDRRKWAQRSLFEQADHFAVEERVPMNAASRRGLADTLQAAICSESMAAQMLTGRLHQPLPTISWPGLTPETFRDELARRRAVRLFERSGRPVDRDDDDDDDDDDDSLALVIPLTGRRARVRRL